MKLLLAEDEKALSKALVTILERNNYAVDAVYNGQETMDYLACGSYDGVILDIMMPKVDGITVLKTIWKRGDLTPVLLLTAKSDADHTLQILAQNGGSFPSTSGWPGNKGGKGNHLRSGSPELPYETRYFYIELDAEGRVETVNTGKIAAVDTQTAAEYAKTVWQSGKTQGFFGDYRYLCTQEQEGTLLVFVDCGRSLDSFRTLLLSSVLFSMGGTALVFVLLLLFSKRIVRPFSEIYEKQKRFITDAGHELKTPLTIIDADAEVLTMDIGENEWVDEICNQTRRLANLTNDLIFLSRMEEQAPTRQAEFPLPV